MLEGKAMRQTEFCNHYRAMSDHDTCAAGVPYDKFKGLKFDQRPCFCRNGKAPGGCDLAVFPTPEEIARRDAETQKQIIAVGTARQAIVAHIGGPWKPGSKTSMGFIDCPVCKGLQTLHYTRAGYN